MDHYPIGMMDPIITKIASESASPVSSGSIITLDGVVVSSAPSTTSSSATAGNVRSIDMLAKVAEACMRGEEMSINNNNDIVLSSTIINNPTSISSNAPPQQPLKKKPRKPRKPRKPKESVPVPAPATAHLQPPTVLPLTSAVLAPPQFMIKPEPTELVQSQPIDLTAPKHSTNTSSTPLSSSTTTLSSVSSSTFTNQQMPLVQVTVQPFKGGQEIELKPEYSVIASKSSNIITDLKPGQRMLNIAPIGQPSTLIATASLGDVAPTNLSSSSPTAHLGSESKTAHQPAEKDKKFDQSNNNNEQAQMDQKLALDYIDDIRKKSSSAAKSVIINGDRALIYQCKLCPDKQFTSTNGLIFHYKKHAGLKPYVCDLCSNTFTRQHSLNYHMLIHLNKSRFRCDECGRHFRHPSHFKEHMRRHTGETPFQCSDCLIK